MPDILSEAKALSEYITDCRRRIHQNPECGFDLPHTLAFVEGELRSMGLEPRRCGRAGLTALIGGDKGGKCFLLRADMDALPDGKGGAFHGCGHDAHTAMLLGAARLLKNHEGELSAPVKLMFQPAEETLEGAKDMLEAGVLENPTVAGAAMVHLMPAVPLPAGTVVLPAEGVGAPAADFFDIEVEGRGCHGSSPNTGVDPICAAAHIIVALQHIPARELAMDEAATLSIGSIHGGEAGNVIPDRLLMKGTLRAMEEETRDFLKGRLGEISRGVAASFGAKAELRFQSGCPGLYNHPGMLSYARARLVEALGGEALRSAADFAAASGRERRTAGSEDFSYISRCVPSLMLALAAGEPEKGFDKPLHHPAVRFDESAFPYGAAALASLALGWGK